MKSLTLAALSAAMLACPIAASAENIYDYGSNDYRVPVTYENVYNYGSNDYRVPVTYDYRAPLPLKRSWDYGVRNRVYYQNSNRYQFRDYRAEEIIRLRYLQELERNRLYDYSYQRDRRFDNRPSVRINLGFGF